MLTRARFGFLAARLMAILLIAEVPAVGIILLMITGHGAWSQTTRTIKITVAVAPGGPDDIVARLLAEQIEWAQGLTVVVEHRPGAGTIVATEAVSRAAPDGASLLMNGNPFVINPLLRKLNYDPLTSFEPICSLATAPTLIAVNSASPYHTLTDLLEAAHAKPGELTLASVGPGTAAHIAFEKLKRAAKVDITFVPYAGTAPAVNALLGEHVTSYLGNYWIVAEQLKAGKLRALATASPTRIAALPDVPTVAESGYKDLSADYWTGVFAPAKTPKETVSQLTGWFTAALQTSEIKAMLAVQGFFPGKMCGADFAVFLRKQYEEFGRIIREANIRAE